MPSRDEIRSHIFSSRNRQTVKFTLFGQKIELKQPPLGELLDAQESFVENRKHATADILIRYCFVPDTNERVFEDTDREQLLNLPAGPDLYRLNKAIHKLIGIDVEEAEKNSEGASGDTTST